MKTAEHLRTARIRLTLAYAAVMAVVLVVMALLIVAVDLRLRESEASGSLLEAAQRAAADVTIDPDGNLDMTVFLSDEAVRAGYPQTWVMAVDPDAPDGIRTVGRPYEDWLGAPPLVDVAIGVVDDDATWMWDFTVGDEPDTERLIVARGVRIGPADDEPVGAVVAAAEADEWLAPHNQLRTTVFLIAGGLVLASAVAGYFLAGRALRPAADALTQQEQLIADAAHELRTPMAQIRAAAEGGIAGDEGATDALDRVARVATTAGTFVDDLLVLARMDAGQERPAMEPLRLDLLVEAEADGYGLTLETVETVVDGDPRLLRRAVHNLIANAITHGGGGDGSDVTVTVYPNRVVVADRGPGIDPAVADTAFERFRTGPGSSGHGLGLAIVRWIVEAHGGRVAIEPREGGGTTAQIILPSSS